MTALLETCLLLNREAWKIGPEKIDELRSHGFTDEAIHDAFQVAAYFAYINRIADGLGVDLEQEMPPKPTDWAR